MKIPHLLFLLFVSPFIFAQDIKTDTAKARKLINIGVKFYKKKDLKQANNYYEQATVLDKQHKNYERYLLIKNYIASNKRELGELAAATAITEKSIKESRLFLGANHPREASAYNTLAVIKSIQNEYDEAIRIYKKILEIHQLNGQQDERCAIYNNLALAFYLKNDFETALTYFKQNETCVIESGLTANLASLYNNSGALYMALGNKEEALEYMLKAVAIIEENDPENWREAARQYTNCSIICQELEQPNRALDYLRKAEGLLEGKDAKKLLAQMYNSKAMIYARDQDIKNTIVNLEKERKLREEYGSDLLDLALCYVNLVKHYGELNKKETFEKYSTAAIEIYNNIEGEQGGLAKCYEAMADVYADWGMVEENKVAFEKARNIYLDIYGEKHPNVASVYTDRGVFFRKKGAYEQAEAFLKKGLNANVSKERVDLKKVIEHKQYLDINQLQQNLGQLQLLYNKWYQETGNENYLKESYNYSLLAQQILFTQREALAQNEDKKTLVAKAHNIIANTIFTTQEYYTLTKEQKYIETALQAAEKSKSIILLESLKGNAAEKFGGLPDSIQKEEFALKKQITSLEKQVIDAKGAQQNDLQKKLKNQLFDQKRALEKLYEKIKVTFPKYAQLKQGGIDLNLQELQQKALDEKTALIEYFIADSSCFLFVITKDNSVFIKLPVTGNKIKQKVKQLRTALSNYKYILNDEKRAYEQYTKTAHWFYKELFAVAISHLKGIEHLIFVPDGTLGHLPFEVFLVEKPSKKLPYSQLHYLFQDYSIRYSYSAALLLENQKGLSKNSSKDVLKLYAFAASYDEIADSNLTKRTLRQQKIRKQLIPLPAVTAELNQLEKLFGEGHYYYGIDANESNLKKHAEEIDVLHLAMHGILNTNHPFTSSLAFTENLDSLEDNFLYAYEISQLNLKTELVILSACETGYGRFEQGEGVMSLARSFMYAGVPSLIVSLWQVNDASTALIMQSFYQGLKSGLPKDIALQKAKMNYLKSTTGITSHPVYWAPFIQLGTANALLEQPISKWWWLLGVGLFLGGALYIMNKFRKKEAIK